MAVSRARLEAVEGVLWKYHGKLGMQSTAREVLLALDALEKPSGTDIVERLLTPLDVGLFGFYFFAVVILSFGGTQ